MFMFRKPRCVEMVFFTLILVQSFSLADIRCTVFAEANRGDNPIPRHQEEQDPTPISVSDAETIFDARRFPAPGGKAAESYSTALMGIYKIDDDLGNVVNQTKKAFESSGWETIKFDESVKDAAMIQVTKGGLMVNCSISKQGKSPCQLFLNVVGNVDLSQLTKPQVKSVEHDRRDFLMFHAELKPDDVLAFYDDSLVKKGWQRYESFGDTPRDDGERKRASYRYNGVSLNVMAQPADNLSQVTVSVGLLPKDVPTPAGVSELRLDANLFRQSFQSPQSVPELLKYFTSAMKRSGRNMLAGRVFKDEQAAMFLTHPREEPVFLEIVKQPNGHSRVYMSSPTRQVTRAMKSPPEFEVAYDKSFPLGETQMHRLPFSEIPFHQELPEGSGRTIAESVFYNTNKSVEESFAFYQDFFAKRQWTAGKRQDEFIGDKMTDSSIKFTTADAEITVSVRPWLEGIHRINIEGNGIQWPGNGFCQMLARDEGEEIPWPLVSEINDDQKK
jgi:hypothetical protein